MIPSLRLGRRVFCEAVPGGFTADSCFPVIIPFFTCHYFGTDVESPRCGIARFFIRLLLKGEEKNLGKARSSTIKQ